jgi:hypothetical protein
MFSIFDLVMSEQSSWAAGSVKPRSDYVHDLIYMGMLC